MMRRCYQATCDCCGHTQLVVNPPGFGSIGYAERRLRKRGWKLGKRDRCRLCVAAGKAADLFAELFEDAGPREVAR